MTAVRLVVEARYDGRKNTEDENDKKKKKNYRTGRALKNAYWYSGRTV